ncbi:MAG: hypothetical protein ABSD71_14150 [Bacteroidales bacterium]
MLANGSPLTSRRSARAPETTRPRSVSPNRRAMIEVADRRASIGVNPAATRSCSSWCRLAPWARPPRMGIGSDTSVPA